MKSKTIDKKIKGSINKIYMLLIVLMIALVFILIFNTDIFVINSIIVLNNHNVSNDEVINYSGIYKGQNIFKLKISDSTNKIINHPYIKDAMVKRKFPNEIIIDVIEREKIAAINHMGIYFLIDSEGYILKTEQTVTKEIVIEGFEINDFIEGNKINIKENKALEIALSLCELINDTTFETLPKIIYNENVLELLINDNYKVKFGLNGDLYQKYNDFLNIYNDLTNKNIYNGIIDLSHNGYPIYRPFGE